MASEIKNSPINLLLNVRKQGIMQTEAEKNAVEALKGLDAKDKEDECLPFLQNMQAQLDNVHHKIVQQERMIQTYEQHLQKEPLTKMGQAKIQPSQPKEVSWGSFPSLAANATDDSMERMDTAKDDSVKSMKSAKNINVESMEDVSRKGIESASDESMQGMKSTSNENMQGIKSTSDESMQGMKSTSDESMQGMKSTSDESMQGMKSTSDVNRNDNPLHITKTDIKRLAKMTKGGKPRTKKKHRKQKSKRRKTPYKNRRKSNKQRRRRRGSRIRIKKKTIKQR
jgi:hypothetical protein